MGQEISVIIPTLDRVEDLRLTLNSYAQGSQLPEEVVIVDQSRQNADAVRALAASYSDRFRVVYAYQQVPSSTKARNLGISLASHEILVFSDDDVTLERDTIANLRARMEDPSLAMIAGLDRNTPLGKSRLGYLFCKKSWRARNQGHVTGSMLGRFPEGEVLDEVPTQWAMGFFFAVRRSLLRAWSLGWDEALSSYAYAEDLDFSFTYYRRAKEAGLRCVMRGDVRVWHRVSPVARIPSRKVTMMRVINRTYLSYKHFPHRPGSRLALEWSLVGDAAQGILRGRSPRDLLDAQRVCRVNRASLRQGVLDPAWYDTK